MLSLFNFIFIWFIFFSHCDIRRIFSPNVCVIIYHPSLHFRVLVLIQGLQRFFLLFKPIFDKVNKGRVASFLWETNWGRGELRVGIFFCGHNDKKGLDTRTSHCLCFHIPKLELFKPFSSQWNEDRLSQDAADKSCDPGSQLRVQIRSFWGVSDMTSVKQVLLMKKTHPLQPSPCPTNLIWTATQV